MYADKTHELTNEFDEFATAHHRSAVRRWLAPALIGSDLNPFQGFGLGTWGLQFISRDEETDVYKFNEHAIIKVDRSSVGLEPAEKLERKRYLDRNYLKLSECLGDVVVNQQTVIGKHPAHGEESVVQRKQEFIKYDEAMWRDEEIWLFSDHGRFVDEKAATRLATMEPTIAEQFRLLARKSRAYSKANDGKLPDIYDNLVVTNDLSRLVLLSTTPLERPSKLDIYLKFFHERTRSILDVFEEIGSLALS